MWDNQKQQKSCFLLCQTYNQGIKMWDNQKQQKSCFLLCQTYNPTIVFN